jgi:hypothetical protein
MIGEDLGAKPGRRKIPAQGFGSKNVVLGGITSPASAIAG